MQKTVGHDCFCTLPKIVKYKQQDAFATSHAQQKNASTLFCMAKKIPEKALLFSFSARYRCGYLSKISLWRWLFRSQSFVR